MPEQDPHSVQTAYGPVDATALHDLTLSFDTSTILRMVDQLDVMCARLCPPEGVRDDLLRLHGMAHTVLNGAPLSASTADATLAEQTDDLLEELEDDIKVLRAVLEQLRPLAALRVR